MSEKSVERLLATGSVERLSAIRNSINVKVPFVWMYLYKNGDSSRLTIVNAFNGKVADNIFDKVVAIINESSATAEKSEKPKKTRSKTKKLAS